jgi:lipid-A-disaccharide synthase
MPPFADKSVMIITGEASGDLHGARVAADLMKRGIRIFGIGGDRLKAVGVRLFVHSDTLSVMGISEVFGRLGAIRAGLSVAKSALIKERPDLLFLIDFPDFNLRMAAEAKRLKIPVLYYISPKIWAWRRQRVKKIRSLVDRMAVIFPFEKPFYDHNGVKTVFVGNPVLDIPAYRDPELYRKPFSGPWTIGLLPGSREMEIKRHLPILLDAARLLHHKKKETRYLLSLMPSFWKEPYLEMIRNARQHVPIEVTSKPAAEIFRRCHILAAASGTVTLEAAVCGCPMVVLYRVSRLSYLVGKTMIRVPHISLVNLIAGREVVPELIQDKADAVYVVRELLRLLENTERFHHMRDDLLEVRKRLGSPGASGRVAELAMEMLGHQNREGTH